jgi:hypothetical protein
MKILVFLSLLAISALAYSNEYDTLNLKGHIHSIINDVPKKEYTFIVDNVSSTESYIHQYQGDVLVETFEFQDQVYHLYASSDGILYVTLNTTNRLLIIDYRSKEPVKSIAKKYAVGFANKKLLIASIASSNIAKDNSYYEETGLALLNINTYEQEAFLAATFIIDVNAKTLLLKEIDKWGQPDERSRLILMNTETLEKNHLISTSGNTSQTACSLSVDGKFALVSDNNMLNIYDTQSKKLYKKILISVSPRKSKFVSEHHIALFESNTVGGYQIEILNILTLDKKTIQINMKLVNNGTLIFDYSASSLTLYSTMSNIVQRIKI